MSDTLPPTGASGQRRDRGWTVAAEFTAEERNLLVRLPRWIVDAAVGAGGASRARHEVDNGFLAVAAGRKLGNPLVAELADAAITVYDHDPKTSGVDPATEEGRDLVLGYSQTAMKILRTKAVEADSSTYR